VSRAKKTAPAPRARAAHAVGQKTALQLRTEGLTFEAIGQKLGITRQSAHEAVKRGLEAVAAERRALAGNLLDAELEQVDFVCRSLVPKVIKGDPKAAMAFLKAQERRAKLLGLDAPTRADTTLSGPGGAPVEVSVAVADPTALHARLAAAAARAARGADPGAAGGPDGDGAGGDRGGA
jgi:hypothetical protein